MAHRLVGQPLQRLRVLVDLAVRLVVLAGVVEHQREIRDRVLQRLVAVVTQLWGRVRACAQEGLNEQQLGDIVIGLYQDL